MNRPSLPRFSRRRFLGASTAAIGALAVGRQALAQTPVPQPTQTPPNQLGQPIQQVGERSPFVSLQRTFAENPFDTASWSFTPLQDLHGIITPADLHFERIHSGTPTIDPAQHRLVITGLVERPTEFTVDDIKRFPAVSRIMFLECSGNSLYCYGTTSPDATAQSLHGLTSTSEWTGVAVKTLLNEVGVRSDARWALAVGADANHMDRSIPIEKLMDDALIAYAQNGEPLRPSQGFPIRLFLPGWEGNAHIKWIERLELGAEPFMTREETSKYTDVLPDGTSWQFTFPMLVKSVITFPSSGQVLPSRGYWEISGISWSGLGKISKVEVSVDNGQTWNEAQLQDPVLPLAHTRFRFPWSWNGEEAIIMSRATDETGETQLTKEELVNRVGTAHVYHYNGIQPWKIGRDGRVTNALQPLS